MRSFLMGLLFFAVSSAAQADMIATWTFETSQPAAVNADAGPFNAELGVGTASGHHLTPATTTTTYSTPVGNGSAHSFSSNNWNIGDYYQFNISTTGFSNLALSFDATSSGTGPRDFKVQTSTNGTTFTDLASGAFAVLANASPNPTWSSLPANAHPEFHFSFTGLPTGIVSIRLVDTSTSAANNTGTVGTAGTDRIDNVVVTGAAVPEPASLTLLGLGAAGLAMRFRRKSKLAAGQESLS